MGFFSKNKLSLNQLAEGLVDVFILGSLSSQELKPFLELLDSLGENTKLSEPQRQDFLIFRMLAVSLAIGATLGKTDICKKLQDEFHKISYEKLYEEEKDQEEFQNLINDRYEAYHIVFNRNEGQDDSITNYYLGRRFAKFFFDREIGPRELAFVYANLGSFSSTMIASGQMIKEAAQKFQISY